MLERFFSSNALVPESLADLRQPKHTEQHLVLEDNLEVSAQIQSFDLMNKGIAWNRWFRDTVCLFPR